MEIRPEVFFSVIWNFILNLEFEKLIENLYQKHVDIINILNMYFVEPDEAKRGTRVALGITKSQAREGFHLVCLDSAHTDSSCPALHSDFTSHSESHQYRWTGAVVRGNQCRTRLLLCDGLAEVGTTVSWIHWRSVATRLCAVDWGSLCHGWLSILSMEGEFKCSTASNYT